MVSNVCIVSDMMLLLLVTNALFTASSIVAPMIQSSFYQCIVCEGIVRWSIQCEKSLDYWMEFHLDQYKSLVITFYSVLFFSCGGSSCQGLVSSIKYQVFSIKYQVSSIKYQVS
eukprot:885824_1